MDHDLRLDEIGENIELGILGNVDAVTEQDASQDHHDADVQLQAVEVRRATDLERAFATVAGWQADALLVIEDPTLLPALQTEIVDFAVRHRLPTMTGVRSLVDAGGLMSYGASFPDMYRRAATFVVKILQGAKPSDLPVEQPTKFDLIMNLKTAKALGITIPPSLLLLADEVIQ